MVAIFLLPLFLFSQNRIYEEIYNLNTSVAPKKITPEKSRISYLDGNVYQIGQNSAIDNDDLIIKKFNTKSKQLELLRLKKAKEYKSLFSEIIYSFEITPRKLVILTGNYIYFFQYKKNDFIFESSVKNTGSFTKLHKLNSEELLLYVNYNFHPMDVKNKHAWAKISLTYDSVLPLKKMGDENARFSYFVNEWLSTYKNLIAHAETDEYVIRFYNNNFQIIDSIKSNLFDSNIRVLSLIPEGNEYSADEMNKIKKADDTLLSRIQKIFLLDSTHLLVMVKLPKTRDMRFDIWKKDYTGWKISKSDTLPSYYEVNKSYSTANNKITGFFGNFDGLIYAGNSDFYFFYFPFSENVITDSFDRKKDYDDKINDLTRKNQLFYGVKKLHILQD